jgi:CubicO group peptidase (beta-lactamase class C family)
MALRTRIAVACVVSLLFFALRGSPLDAFPDKASSRPQSNDASSDDPAPLIARIEAPQVPDRQGLDGLTLQQVMERLHTPGMSIAVIKNFKIHWAKAYGIADIKTGRPVQTDTLFQAASISKPVTAMAALRLVQDGRFSLDDDVNTLLKSWQVPKTDLIRDQPVTPRSLFSHTSGADDGFGFPGYPPGVALPTVVQVLNGQPPSNLGPVRFTRRPYAAYKYSGGGVLIMQLALTDLLAQPFEEIMQTNVLKPLGMSSSSYQQPLPGSQQARAAHAYDADGHAMDAPWHVYPEQAPAGLWTTPSDLARLVIELQRAIQGPSGTVLKQATAREMIAPTGVGPFAVGFEIGKTGEGWYFSHSGGNWGFRCHLLGHVRKGYGVVIMTNGDSGTKVVEEIESRVAAAYHWDTLDKPVFR